MAEVTATVKRTDQVPTTEKVTLEPVGSWLRVVIPRCAVLTLKWSDIDAVRPAGQRKVA